MDPQNTTTISVPTTTVQLGKQNQYELTTDIGKITIETIIFPHYFQLIDSQWFPTSFHANSICTNDKPTVVDIGADDNQAEGDQFCMKLSKELSCAVVLSYNLQQRFTTKDQASILKFLKEHVQASRKHEQMVN